MPWKKTEAHSCCDDAYYRTTGKVSKNDSDVLVYSKCKNCEAKFRDVFVLRENRTDYWMISIGGDGPHRASARWEQSEAPRSDDVILELDETRESIRPDWLPNYEENPEEYNEAVDDFKNHEHDWIEEHSSNDGDWYEIDYSCDYHKCPLKKREYYKYSYCEADTSTL